MKRKTKSLQLNRPGSCSLAPMAGANSHLRTLSQQDWEYLFQQTLLFAHYQVRRLRWRGAHGGVMPDGFDANSLAAQAFLDFFLNASSDASQPNYRGLPSPRTSSSSSSSIFCARCVSGTAPSECPNGLTETKERPELLRVRSLSPESFLTHSDDRSQAPPASLDDILYQLKRLVLKHVTRLHHRKENLILSNAEDLAHVQTDHNEPFLNLIELIPDLPANQPDACFLEKESLDHFESSKSRFSSFIQRERRLARLFQLICKGTDKPQALARQLKIRRAAIINLRKQLRRRWRDCFSSSRPSRLR